MRKTIIASVGLLVLALAVSANAQSIDTAINGAQQDAASARSRLDALRVEIDQMQVQMRTIEANEARLIRAILNSEHHQQVLWAQLQDAREVLIHRAAAAYQVGPAAALEVFLSVSSPSELASAAAYTERAFGSDTDLIATVEFRRDEAERGARILREQRKALDAEQSRLQGILDEIAVRLSEAEQVAEAANLKVEQLQEKKQALVDAARREAARQDALDNPKFTGSSNADWDAIAMCEASGNWAANTGNGYWGGLQFHPSTWYAYGGGHFDGHGPFPYGRSEQIVVGEKVLASQGPGAWPNCYRSR
jgi:peptidoglycan hydrolase CwlO-like protein